MKVLKKNELSLFIKPLGLKDKLFLCLGVLVYFDLLSPENLPGEQKLWQEVTPLLGDPPVLDLCFPKARGEFLVAGKCYAPGKKPTPVSEVMVRVGDVEKKLYVFGDRFWQKKKGLTVISEPVPFVKKDISWKNGFGGQGFAKNPLGKGLDPVTFGDGVSLVPLPNLEYPDKLIVSPSDRPDPACFGPVDMMWPQRAKKRGTYDDKWLKERWPYFPDDLDYEFFNMASEDQFLPDFFTGDEDIEILNMHPEHSLIKSRLPKIRVRAFVTKKKDLNGTEEDENLIFEEVPLTIDTLWLFPEILRGVVIYRGLTEILDEELDDIHRIFLALEDPAEEPAPLEKYWDEQKKFFDRAVPIDKSKLADMQGKIASMLKSVRELPKKIDKIKNSFLGKVPVMPPGSPQESKEKFLQFIDKHLSLIDTLEAQSIKMQKKWGHIVKIHDKDFFANARKILMSQKEHISNVTKKRQEFLKDMEEAKQDVKKALEKSLKMVKEKVPQEHLKNAGINLEKEFFPEDDSFNSINPWHDKGFPFVVRCRRELDRHEDVLDKLKEMGFNKQTIYDNWFGLNTKEERYHPKEWGLEQDKENVEEIMLPTGLVIPRFNGKELVRILIRKEDLVSGEDILVKGSDKTPLFIPAVSILDIPGAPKKESAPVIRVHDELQARFLEQEIGYCCSIVVLSEPSEELPDEVKEAISKAEVFLVLLTKKEEDKKIGDKFCSVFPNCKTCVIEKGDTLFDMHKNDVNVRMWIMEKLPDEFVEENKIDFDVLKRDPGMFSAFSSINFSEMLKGLYKDIEEVNKVKKQEFFRELEKDEKNIIESLSKNHVKNAFLKANTDLDEVLKGIKKVFAEIKSPTSKKEFKADFEPDDNVVDDILGKLKEVKNYLEKQGYLTDEIRSKLESEEASLLSFKELMKTIPKGKKDFEKAKEEIKENLKQAGVDPDKTKQLTREEVIEIYKKTKSLEGRILSGLDLSGLDLKGVNLKGAICIGTNFKNTILDGANLSGVIARDADFSGASMKNTVSIKGIFTGSSIKEANLQGAYLKMCSLDKVDFTATDFQNARIEMVIFQGANFKDTNMQNTKIKMSMLNETKMSKVNLSSSELEKCMFQKSSLKEVDFTSSYIKSTQFFETKAENVSFRRSTIDNGRMGKESFFQYTDFRDTEMIQACFRESDLSNSDFTGSTIENSMFEKCKLREANFFLVPMKHARFLKCDLEGANMRGVNLFLGSLKKSRLVQTDLRDSNLFSVDFYKTTLGQTKIKGANLKRTFLKKRLEFLTSREIEQ
ncbi:MAG: DUF2169 domain-containing protein [Desulfonauticus sp.]|nr:DUF2169 domain-containing protein [Desulfonauticus sp.]